MSRRFTIGICILVAMKMLSPTTRGAALNSESSVFSVPARPICSLGALCQRSFPVVGSSAWMTPSCRCWVGSRAPNPQASRH